MPSAYTPNFIAPTGAGRPENLTDIPIEITDFSMGIDTFYDSIASTSPTYFATNARSYRGRTLNSRLGTELTGSTAASSGSGYMLSTLNALSGDDVMLKIIDNVAGNGVQLYKYTTAGGWATLGAVFGSNSDRVDYSSFRTVIGGEARTYYTNGVTLLRYTNGTTISTVTDGATDIKGKYITGVQNVMALGCLTGTFARNQYVVAKAGTHQFRKDVDVSYAASSNVVTLDSEITGAASLGWMMYFFTKADGLWEHDPKTGIPRQISTHGTVSPKSVAVGSNAMIWCDYYGVWMLTLGGNVQKISNRISDVYIKANFADAENFNATITQDGLYKLWVGDLTYEGDALTDVCLVFDIEGSRDAGFPIWWVDDNKESRNWTNWTNEVGATNSYYINQSTGATYLDGTDNDDSGSNITFRWQSKDMLLVDDKNEYVLKELYWKVQPDTAVDSEFNVYVRIDRGAWKLLKTFTLNHSSNELKRLRITSIQSIKGATLGIKVTSAGVGAIQFYEMKMVYNKNHNELRPVNLTI